MHDIAHFAVVRCATERLAQDGETPLIRASFFGHTSTATALVLLGADVNAKDNVGAACCWRARGGAHGAGRVLRGLTMPPKGGGTALLRAVYQDRIATAVELVRLGADVNARTLVRASARVHVAGRLLAWPTHPSTSG